MFIDIATKLCLTYFDDDDRSHEMNEKWKANQSATSFWFRFGIFFIEIMLSIYLYIYLINVTDVSDVFAILNLTLCVSHFYLLSISNDRIKQNSTGARKKYDFYYLELLIEFHVFLTNAF